METRILDNGSKFTGVLKNSIPHGLGIQKFTDGSVYKGEFKMGQRHGNGEFTSIKGEEYTGS